MKGAVVHGRTLDADVRERCDVCVIGSGAGGGMLAEGLVQAGLDVVMIEEGGYASRRDFTLHEFDAMPLLYQGRGLLTTDDLSVMLFQGRTVGGSTTVNWTGCFRTPARVLDHWRARHGVVLGDLDPHFEAVEARLSVVEWPEAAMNTNNRALLAGARALGWETRPLRRNVRGCANTGYCGLGCPLDRKQSQLVTTIPAALAGGMRLYSDVSAQRIRVSGGRARVVEAVAMDPVTSQPSGRRVEVEARVVALCAGAIHSPVLLLRSGIAGGPVGWRTFLHPLVGVLAEYPDPVQAWAGAPVAAGSWQHADRGPEKMGFFLEASGLQPATAALPSGAMGPELAERMRRLPYLGSIVAMHIDGLVPGDQGGRVWLDRRGRRHLDYPISAALREALPVSHRALAELCFAAGALRVDTQHKRPLTLRGPADLPLLEQAPYGAHQHAILSAHVMGGAAMGPDPSTSVVDLDLRHHRVPNLFLVDGSVLPTSLGVNPSETLYALAHRARATVAASV